MWNTARCLATRFSVAATLLLAAATFSTDANAEDLEFTLKNRSSYDVIEFYASPNDVGDWEEDILGEDILSSGDAVQITIGDGRTQCSYDLRFVFEDGDVVERPAVDLCSTGSYTLTD